MSKFSEISLKRFERSEQSWVKDDSYKLFGHIHVQTIGLQFSVVPNSIGHFGLEDLTSLLYTENVHNIFHKFGCNRPRIVRCKSDRLKITIPVPFSMCRGIEWLWRKGFVKEMSFKSGVKGRGSDRWWERNCNEVICAGWGEPGEWTHQHNEVRWCISKGAVGDL